MAAIAARRVVLVTRRTEYARLIERHATHDQARFFLSTRGQSIEPVHERHLEFAAALRDVSAAVPVDWRRARVERTDLDRFLFEEDDIVVALGQDGLVANVAKYLEGQPVVGLNPAPDLYPGILVPHPPKAAADLLAAVNSGRAIVEGRSMAEATLADGQRLVALNEVYVGHRSHQSARYEITFGDLSEPQSSSGLIVATGTGATGWASSIHRACGSRLRLPGATENCLAFFVREAWPSAATGTTCTEGRIDEGRSLHIVSRMEQGGVLFGDGIEEDAVELPWGSRIEVRLSDRRLNLVRG